ncbi:hypothetical protein [Pseudomonas sp. MH9.3]|uniref:hypothetical protein n=2 Tax=Pseudomonas TaxID=286 RepID=UPI002AC9DBF0|nr:hypothetical protein [Pseudomonas sp. MH9.3]MEB0107475.1 hypothetical protein [Pseudomonas sp. MH9.3]WPX80867.1 hypothetical protein RHM60_07085 [Pseudomonas sp. MH9.3]WQG57326.1 hypothetical protein RHM66_19710 [Pseudomonas sp. RTB3]
MEKKQYQFAAVNTLNIPAQGGDGGGHDGGSGMEKRMGLLEKGLAEMKEKLFAVSSRTDAMEQHSTAIEKHFATKADLATTELNLIKWYVATAFAMTSLACAITFGLGRVLIT